MGQLAQALSSGALKLYINNRPFGIVTGFEWSSDSGRRGIYGLDQTTPFELAPGAALVKGKVDCLKIKLDGGLEGRGIAAPDRDIMLEKYINIALVDRTSGFVVFKCQEAAVNTQTWRIESKGVLRGTFTFEGKEWWSNESEI